MGFFDGFRNLVANLGTDRDKAAHGAYHLTLRDWSALEAAYRTSPLARKIVDIPAEDAGREWREWQAEDDQISALEAEEKRLGLQRKMIRAHKAARLYGGAAIYIGTGEADPEMPINPRTIGRGGVRYLTVLSRIELTEGEIQNDPREPGFGLPSYYTMSSGNASTVRIHPSRLVVLTGEETPSRSVTAQDSWGDSALQAALDAVLAEDGVQANVAALVHEAKVDVLRIPDLMQNMRTGGDLFTRQLTARLALGAQLKGTNGMLVTDANEEYEQKTASFATLPDIMDRFRQKVAAAAQIPMTLLYGTSPGGLNATGDSDIRQYYDRVKVIQSLEIEPAMDILDECLIRSALGDRPEEIHYNWRSLWQATAKEKAEVGKLLTESMKSAYDMRALPDEVIGKALVNGLTECGAFPGLEGYAADYFAEHGEAEPDEVEQGAPGEPPETEGGEEEENDMTRFTDAMIFDGALRKTDDGWVAQARVARGGNVQAYRGAEVGMADKATVRVYRPPEEVFDRKAIQTYARKPITLGHPDGGVSAETWKDLAVGEIDRDVMRDGEFVSVPLLFRDAKAIDSITADGGARELSMGYDASITFEDGETPEGEKYDARMSDFRMNHVAVVPAARGGSDLRIGDGANARWGASPIIIDRKDDDMADSVKTRTVLIDGLSVETTDAGAQALEKLQGVIAAKDKAISDADADHAKAIAAKDAEIAKIEAERDATKGKVLSDADLDKRVADRAELIGKAKVLASDVETKGLSDAAIRKAVVAKAIGADAIEGKSDAYIDARFDILAEDSGKSDKFADTMRSGVSPTAHGTEADKAYADSLVHLSTAYRGEAKKEA